MTSAEAQLPLGVCVTDWRTGVRYRLLQHLGKGSTCKCVSAIREVESGETQVALKITDKDSKRAKKCNRREAKALARCKHQHIIEYIECFERFNFSIVVLEYGGDTTLHALATEANPSLARKAFPQMCAALAHLKSVDYLHRDVKLENFTLHEHTRLVKLCDFGMAIPLRHSKNIGWSGTPLYAAPELVGRWDGVPHFGYPSEVWALGVCLYRLWQGSYPYHAKDIDSLARVLTSSALPALIEDERCADLCDRLLDKAPDRRITIEQAQQHAFCHQSL